MKLSCLWASFCEELLDRSERVSTRKCSHWSRGFEKRGKYHCKRYSRNNRSSGRSVNNWFCKSASWRWLFGATEGITGKVQVLPEPVSRECSQVFFYKDVPLHSKMSISHYPLFLRLLVRRGIGRLWYLSIICCWGQVQAVMSHFWSRGFLQKNYHFWVLP